MSGELMAEEMAEQPEILARIVRRFEEYRRSVAAIAPRPLAGVAFVARGSSANAGLLGRYAAELAAGRPAGLVAPSLHTRYSAEVDYRGYLVVALSQSGETPEIATVAGRLRGRGAKVVALTSTRSSTLGEAADLTICLDAGRERAVPATKTVTAEMLLVLAVAAGLGELDFGAGGLAALPGAVEAVLADPRAAEALAERWAPRDRLLVLGRGFLLASACETALKVRETARLFAQGFSPADLLHGPIASVKEDDPILILNGGGPASADLVEVHGRLTDLAAAVATSGTGGETLSLASGLPEVLQAVAATVRGQQLASSWARARGLDPDFPDGLSKVTRTA